MIKAAHFLYSFDVFEFNCAKSAEKVLIFLELAGSTLNQVYHRLDMKPDRTKGAECRKDDFRFPSPIE